jgi:GDP-4-dehydro-6-deoxy-D-mannose reductase
MPTILITGISGFVGGHFARYLLSLDESWEIHGVSRSLPAWASVGGGGFSPGEVLESVAFYPCDLLDADEVGRVVAEVRPDFVLHLASLSSVAESWREPVASFLNNTNVFLNLVEALRVQGPDGCRVLSVGSSEEYGVVGAEEMPLSESHTIVPANPYAVARVAEEYLARIYARGYGLSVSCTRSFNHIGPGQSDRFVVSSIARQFAELALGLREPVVTIGDGTIIRDFIDIGDVVRAYYSILTSGVAGEVYNVCSGHGHSVLEVVYALAEHSGIDAGVEVDPALLRPIDNPVLVGDYSKLERETGWRPEVSFEASLWKLYRYWLETLS